MNCSTVVVTGSDCSSARFGNGSTTSLSGEGVNGALWGSILPETAEWDGCGMAPSAFAREREGEPAQARRDVWIRDDPWNVLSE